MAVHSNDRDLTDLLGLVESGKAQLPDFQRSWVWDDEKICKTHRINIFRLPYGSCHVP